MTSRAFVLTLLVVIASCRAEREGHIIGGQEAAVGQFPWQGSLQLASGQHTCGCSLISDQWIISAAHCFEEYARPTSVVFGAHDLSNSRVASPRRYYIDTFMQHQGWNGQNVNDIAIARLTERVDLSTPYIKAVKLADSDLNTQKGIISGWGYTDGFRETNVLMYANVWLHPHEYCQQHWHALYNPSKMVCISEPGKSGACMGDSGGPLVAWDGAFWRLVGLTSFGSMTCSPTVPSVYTRVSGYRDWIQAYTQI